MKQVVVQLLCCWLVRVKAFGVHPLLMISWTRKTPYCRLYDGRSCLQLSTASSPDVIDRLDLEESFGRWRFLQRLLEEDASNHDVNQVLYEVLEGFLERPRRVDDEPNETISPILNDVNTEIVQGMLNTADKTVPIFGNGNVINAQMLEQIERLLPDPTENEEAHKGAWETMCEIHGRGSVQANEGKATMSWRAVSSIARVLIYFDFLTSDWYAYKRH
jgi:hypothetical protein